MTGTWLPCSLFPDRYEVSDQGQVRSRLRQVPFKTPDGRPCTRSQGGKLLKIQYGGRNGRYARVRLSSTSDHKDKGTLYSLHTLVCLTFHGKRPDGHLCYHKDDDQANNRADNLYWGTPTQNMLDRSRNHRLAAGGVGDTTDSTVAEHEPTSVPDAGADVELAGVDW